MSNARETILKNIQSACATITDAPAMPDVNFPAPALTAAEQLDRFIHKAEQAKSEVVMGDWQTISEKLPFYCEQYHISDMYCDSDLQTKINLNPLFRDALTDDVRVLNEGAAIVQARFGLYETGTVVCLSNDQPSNALFLPQHLFVVLSAQDLVWDIAAATQTLQQHTGLPRMMNFITGPSCTADIEQTLLYGAHGPKTLTIFLLRN